MFGVRLGSNCPACHSTQVHRSRRNRVERILLPFTAACRCNECGQRFYTVARSIRQQTESFELIKMHRIPKSGTASIR